MNARAATAKALIGLAALATLAALTFASLGWITSDDPLIGAAGLTFGAIILVLAAWPLAAALWIAPNPPPRLVLGGAIACAVLGLIALWLLTIDVPATRLAGTTALPAAIVGAARAARRG